MAWVGWQSFDTYYARPVCRRLLYV